MEAVISILAVAAGIIGIIGCILPGIPGLPVCWTGMLLLYLWGNGTDRYGNEMSLTVLLIWLGVVAVVSAVDYFIPMLFTRMTGGSRYAERGGGCRTCPGDFLHSRGHDSRLFPRCIPF